MSRRHVTLFLFALLALTLPRLSHAQTYVNPSTPFTGNIEPSINSSSTTQTKLGALGVGSATSIAQLCLNANGVGDPTNCISAWPALVSSVGGPFVALAQKSFDEKNVNSACGAGVPQPMCPQEYTLQNGFVHLKASSTNPPQAFTTLVTGPALHVCSSNRATAASGVCLDGPKQGQACMFNTDCNLAATAVYATDGGSPGRTAGYFAGVVNVTAPTNDPYKFFTPHGRICLNGTPESVVDGQGVGANCISSWSQIAPSASNTNYVKRSPSSTQAGGAVLSGVTSVGTAVAGDPSSLSCTSSVSCISCGDGLCSSNEDDTKCPVDCAAIPTPAVASSFDVGTTTINVTPRAQKPNGSKVNIIIVRSITGPVTFQPENGVTYTVGQNIGTDQIVYVGNVNQLTPILPAYQDNVAASGDYHYVVYQANDYPRYGNGFKVDIGQIRKLTVVISRSNAAEVTSDDGQVDCFDNGIGCTAFYRDTDTPQLSLIFLAGYVLQNWVNCSPSSGNPCTVHFGNSDLTVSANLARVVRRP